MIFIWGLGPPQRTASLGRLHASRRVGGRWEFGEQQLRGHQAAGKKCAVGANSVASLAIFYPFGKLCATDTSLPSLQIQTKTASGLFQRGVDYGNGACRAVGRVEGGGESVSLEVIRLQSGEEKRIRPENLARASGNVAAAPALYRKAYGWPHSPHPRSKSLQIRGFDPGRFLLTWG